MMYVSRHVVVLLMDVPVEHRDVGVRHERFHGLRAIARCPIPLRIEIEQRPVREDHDVRILRLLFRSAASHWKCSSPTMAAGSETLSSTMKCTPLWSNV